MHRTIRVTGSTGGIGLETAKRLADLSRPADVDAFASTVTERQGPLDVLLNNAGIFRAPEPVTADGLDVRFAVNTIAP